MGLNATLLTLPAELQILIISHLEIEDQFSASQVCDTWKDIIVNHKTIQKGRYITTPGSQFYTHKLVTIKAEPPESPHFSFKIRNGTLTSFIYHHCGLFSAASNESIVERNRELGSTWRDISECIFIDEQMFSPFIDPHYFPEIGHDKKNPRHRFLVKKLKQNRSLRRPVTPEFNPYDTSDPSYGKDSRYGRTGYEFSTGLSFCHNLTWSSDKWKAELRFQNKTTVREALEAITTEVLSILNDWGIKTDVDHQMIFMTADDNKGVWSLAGGVVTELGDSYKDLEV
ncbi:hypothetical protein H072_7655 [Dactylellina haptotyla CBS 200.50]|uniref:F-box domain-containing protein n=1 Tax=Dactylellina haptotyla (strain CBS 200.50) TaxID=1284197 RepID=S8ABR2_DACHA|nr:hypothetical protein H072_7655 [Dactylellina haptotyla CBS 200.50]